MTKEEVAQVIAYCDENKISYKQRLEELGINPWSFYDAKRKYASKADGENAGEFLQLVPGGAFFPNPIKPARSKSGKQNNAGSEDAVTRSIKWEDLRKMAEGIMADLDRRQARLDGLKNIWKN